MVMPIGFYVDIALTGNQRVRRGFLGKLILQVEVSQIYRHPVRSNEIAEAGVVRLVWRDALPEDLGMKYRSIKYIPQA